MWHCRELAGISGQGWQGLDGPELLRRLVRSCSQRQHEPAPGGSGPHTLTGDPGDQARYEARPGGPGHSRSNLFPVSWVPGDQRGTILGWSLGPGRGCEITEIGHQTSPGVRSLVTATRGDSRQSRGEETLTKCPIVKLSNVFTVWVKIILKIHSHFLAM